MAANGWAIVHLDNVLAEALQCHVAVLNHKTITNYANYFTG